MSHPALPPWETRAPQPDRFPEPAETTGSHPSADPVSMTGGAPLTHQRDAHGRAAAHELTTSARHADPDRAISAALERWVQNRRGRLVPLLGSAVADTNGIAVIDLDGPKIGFVWNLRRLNVGPNDYIATPFLTGLNVIAATGILTPGSEYPTISALQVISTTTKFPAEGTWSESESPVSPGEHILVIIGGASPGTMISVGGRAVELAAGVGETYGPMR